MGTDEQIRSWLERWLPRGTRTLLALGSAPASLAGELPPGVELRAVGATAEAAESESGPRVVFASARTTSALEACLRRARELLSPRGRLLVEGLTTVGPVDRRRLERPLFEAGFVLRESSLDDLRGRLAADFDGYAVDAYRTGDEDEILGLFRRAFHVDRRLDHWHWKFSSNPFGAHHISLVRSPESELVGQYCAYPVRLWRAGATCSVHQVGDTMTAPEVRGVGRGPTSLLARASRHFYSAFCDGAVSFNYGFNTGNIQKFSMRFVGASRVEDVPFRRRDLGRRPVRPAPSWFGRRRVVAEARAESLDDLWLRCRDGFGTLVERDSRYLGWRYLECPDQEYTWVGIGRRKKLIAWGVFARRGDQLVWGDLLVEPKRAEALETLLAAAVARSATTGPPPREVIGWFPDRPAWLHEQLGRMGFEAAPEPQELALMVVPFEDPAAPEHCRERFFYTYGDSDLF